MSRSIVNIKNNLFQVVNPRTGKLNMDINKYIDRELIEEHATDFILDVDNLPKNTQENFLDILIKHDPIMRDIVLDRMQQVVNQRLEVAEQEDKYFKGYEPIEDNQTGETIWVPVPEWKI